MTKLRLFFPVIAVILCLLGIRAVSAAPSPPPEIVKLASSLPSGDAVNDRIFVTFYPASPAGRPAPAVILLHPIGISEGDIADKYMHRLGQRMSARGINCALITLPWHAQRGLKDSSPMSHYLGQDVTADIHSLQQCVSDVRTVTDWLTTRPDVDSHRLGILGISLGAIVAHLAMGQDSRLIAGVALEGGGDLPNLYRHSGEIILNGQSNSHPVASSDLARLRVVDPLQYVDNNRPRRVLMIQAARDLNVPPFNGLVLWNALGRPPIQWIDTNHYGFILANESLVDTATAYLKGVWSGKPDSAIHAPQFHPLTLKVGWLFELSGYTTPAFQWQFYSLAQRPDHMSLVHLDLGESGRGPFLGLAATINPYVDIGVEQRVTGRPIQPYVSLHIVF